MIDIVSADTKAGFGPSLAFAQALLSKQPNLFIGLIPCAKGDTSLDEWQPIRQAQMNARSVTVPV